MSTANCPVMHAALQFFSGATAEKSTIKLGGGRGKQGGGSKPPSSQWKEYVKFILERCPQPRLDS